MSASREDLFSEKSALYSKAFLVEDRELWIPLQVLACASDVFKNMFYGDYAETEKEIIPLPGKKYEQVLEFLRCLIANPLAKEISDENLASNLKLADEYQVQSLTIKCETYLLHKVGANNNTAPCTDNDSILGMLELASQYNLETLMKEQLIPKAVNIPLEVLQGAYGKQIKSNIFMAILDLKLQQYVPAVGAFSCSGCHRSNPCCYYNCGHLVYSAQPTQDGQPNKGLREEILKRKL